MMFSALITWAEQRFGPFREIAIKNLGNDRYDVIIHKQAEVKFVNVTITSGSDVKIVPRSYNG